MIPKARFFYNHREALLVRRPNRFLIIAESAGEELPCHCPNPGRLIEFMFPGMPLILEGRANSDSLAVKENKGRKTGWTVVGVRYKDAIVPLYSARANQAARELVLPRIIPDLAKVRSEYVLGDSRFDFLCIGKDGTRHLVEVKSCSLVEHGVAMFPDAPSLRAGKHVRELAALSRENYVCHVLFLIGHGSPRCFVPNLHTDPDFAAALWQAGDTLQVHAALVRCDDQGMASLAAESIPVNLEPGRLAKENCGSYMMVLEVPETHDIEVGALGTVHFQAGWYVYCGSAQKNLRQRVARHSRKVRKQQHWHLDYLTPYAASIKGLPIMSERNLECDLARSMEGLGGIPVPHFGSSDCRCDSHLFFFEQPPMRNMAFVDTLLRYRSQF